MRFSSRFKLSFFKKNLFPPIFLSLSIVGLLFVYHNCSKNSGSPASSSNVASAINKETVIEGVAPNDIAENSNLINEENNKVDGAPLLVVFPPSHTSTTNQDVSYKVSYSNVQSITLDESYIELIKTGTANAEVELAKDPENPNSYIITLARINGEGSLAILIKEGSAYSQDNTKAYSILSGNVLVQNNQPLNTEVAPPTNTEVAPPTNTEVAPPTNTEIAPPTSTEVAPPQTVTNPPSESDLNPIIPIINIAEPTVSGIKGKTVVSYIVTYSNAERITLKSSSLIPMDCSTCLKANKITISGRGNTRKIKLSQFNEMSGIIGIGLKPGTARNGIEKDKGASSILKVLNISNTRNSPSELSPVNE